MKYQWWRAAGKAVDDLTIDDLVAVELTNDGRVIRAMYPEHGDFSVGYVVDGMVGAADFLFDHDGDYRNAAKWLQHEDDAAKWALLRDDGDPLAEAQS